MSVLVAYASQYGATRGIAERIAEVLRREGVITELRSVDHPGPVEDAYDAFVVGSAVHAGHWLKPASEFVKANAAALATRPVWLFSSGPIGDAADRPQPDPAEIGQFQRLFAPRGHVVFGGAFDRAAAETQGGWLEKTFSRFIPEGDFRDWPVIEAWARDVARELVPAPVA
jgi:menaquinone-dependent protoporphyrinogen oxidase